MKTETRDYGYLALSDIHSDSGGVSDPRPGIVLIHDVWGLAEHPCNFARRLAREGLVLWG